MPTYVLVHGGAHGAWCWQPLLPHLDGPAVAIDLPPKSVRGVPDAPLPPELATLGIADFATSALADIDAAGIDRFVLVGHSMGGLTISEIARRVPERVERLVYVSCIVAPEGGSVIDTLPEDFRQPVRDAIAAARAGDLAAGPATSLSDDDLRRMFCNDMDEEQTAFVLAHCGAEAPSIFDDPVTRVGIPPELPKLYVRLRRDQALSPDDQAAQIEHLRASPGGVLDVVELDTGHNVMISAPEKLAAVLTNASS